MDKSKDEEWQAVLVLGGLKGLLYSPPRADVYNQARKLLGLRVSPRQGLVMGGEILRQCPIECPAPVDEMLRPDCSPKP